jgi:hypothetical protein
MKMSSLIISILFSNFFINQDFLYLKFIIMYELSAHAVRQHGSIEVTMVGFLPTSCHQASIKDFYPGGNIMYVKDPGHAQVFIEETSRGGSSFCQMVLVPWAATITIVDDFHTTVTIYVNRQLQLTVPIQEKSKAQFIVVQLTGGIVPNGAYSILPADAFYPAIFTKVFGPDSYANCDIWVKENTKLPFSFLDGLALGFGGGGEMPRGAQTAGGGGGAPHGVANAEGGGGGNPHGLKVLIERGGKGNPRGL